MLCPTPEKPKCFGNARLKIPRMQDVYILSAVRTPIGKFGGSLASMTAADMGAVAAKSAIERAGIRPEQIEETIFGNARQAGGGLIPRGRFPFAAGFHRKCQRIR